MVELLGRCVSVTEWQFGSQTHGCWAGSASQESPAASSAWSWINWGIAGLVCNMAQFALLDSAFASIAKAELPLLPSSGASLGSDWKPCASSAKSWQMCQQNPSRHRHQPKGGCFSCLRAVLWGFVLARTLCPGPGCFQPVLLLLSSTAEPCAHVCSPGGLSHTADTSQGPADRSTPVVLHRTSSKSCQLLQEQRRRQSCESGGQSLVCLVQENQIVHVLCQGAVTEHHLGAKL